MHRLDESESVAVQKHWVSELAFCVVIYPRIVTREIAAIPTPHEAFESIALLLPFD